MLVEITGKRYEEKLITTSLKVAEKSKIRQSQKCLPYLHIRLGIIMNTECII